MPISQAMPCCPNYLPPDQCSIKHNAAKQKAARAVRVREQGSLATTARLACVYPVAAVAQQVDLMSQSPAAGGGQGVCMCACGCGEGIL